MLYSLFAALATLVNIAIQALVIHCYAGEYPIELSILAGTACGLPIKYVLDKQYIFIFKARNRFHDSQMLLFYSITGIFTTLLFWSVEYLFQWTFDTNVMRYIGGVIGLSIGYIIKYHLDKRFVFVDS